VYVQTGGSPYVNGEDAPPIHLLVCEFRGPEEVHDELIELLVQVRRFHHSNEIIICAPPSAEAGSPVTRMNQSGGRCACARTGCCTTFPVWATSRAMCRASKLQASRRRARMARRAALGRARSRSRSAVASSRGLQRSLRWTRSSSGRRANTHHRRSRCCRRRKQRGSSGRSRRSRRSNSSQRMSTTSIAGGNPSSLAVRSRLVWGFTGCSGWRTRTI